MQSGKVHYTRCLSFRGAGGNRTLSTGTHLGRLPFQPRRAPFDGTNPTSGARPNRIPVTDLHGSPTISGRQRSKHLSSPGFLRTSMAKGSKPFYHPLSD